MKLWHCSDLHLSFSSDGRILKRMDERTWSKGTLSYVGYLEAIKKFSDEFISDEDFVIISGDLTHNMSRKQYGPSVEWIKSNIKGIKVVIPGNHDDAIDFVDMRIKHGSGVFHPLEEGEMINLGDYTFGCYQSTRKSDKQDHDKLLNFANKLIEYAESKARIPVLISHYCVPVDIAEKLGKVGIKYYLSGHVHITKNTNESGFDLQWYNQSAGLTDNKNINECFFSTATTDLMFHTTGGYFKELPLLPKQVRAANPRTRACDVFHCSESMLDYFIKSDPFNPENLVEGLICRQKGKLQGSLYIIKVNGKPATQVIYGTPKLEYPYIKGTTEYDQKLNYVKLYMIAEKFNGMNVLMYKYKNSEGQVFITGKSKGTPFLTDGIFGNFFSLTKSCLNKVDFFLEDLKLNKDYQSISFELCGNLEPHLVAYDFDIDLKPLFRTHTDGKIFPLLGSLYTNKGNIIENLKDIQESDFKLNEEYRVEYGLPHKYEYNYFAVEGKVLYILDEAGYFSYDRVMYKIKPKDVEEVHWQTFDKVMQGRVKEAVKKLQISGQLITEQNIGYELEMGPKEWGKFGKDVMRYAIQNTNDARSVTILCGLPGSGKSTLALQLALKDTEEGLSTTIINQDDIGSKKACKVKMEMALKQCKNVIIDRCNFDINQRKCWIDIATKYGVGTIKCVVLKTPTELCKQRVITRQNHPTLPAEEKSAEVVTQFERIWIEPALEEGFTEIVYHEINNSGN